MKRFTVRASMSAAIGALLPIAAFAQSTPPPPIPAQLPTFPTQNQVVILAELPAQMSLALGPALLEINNGAATGDAGRFHNAVQLFQNQLGADIGITESRLLNQSAEVAERKGSADAISGEEGILGRLIALDQDVLTATAPAPPATAQASDGS